MEDAKGDRHPGVYCQRFQPAEIIFPQVGIDIRIFSSDFKNSGPHLAHYTHQLSYLVPRGQATRDRLPVGRLVIARP